MTAGARRNEPTPQDIDNTCALIDLLSQLCKDREACAALPFIAAWVIGEEVVVVRAASAEERARKVTAHPTPPPNGALACAELTKEFIEGLLGEHHAAILNDSIRSRAVAP